jgi:ABC-type Fe3+ transport system substrate-binding protein
MTFRIPILPALLTLAALHIPARADEAALYAAAKAEGQVTWYTTLIINVGVRPLVAAFEKKYPGIEVRYSRADSGPTAVKVLNEASAGKLQADIVDGTDSLPPLRRAGLLAKYSPASAEKYPAAMQDPEGYWHATLVYFLTPAFNTALVPPATAPKTIKELLDPKWKGKMAWTTSRGSGGPAFVGAVLQSLGEADGMAYLKALARQDIANVNVAARALLDQCAAGEYPIVLNIFNHHAAMMATKGAPIDWIKLDVIGAPMQVSALLKDAPHPNAGKLFLDFMASSEGQTILAGADLLPAMPGVPVTYPQVKPDAAGFTPTYLPQELLARESERWLDIYRDLFFH